MSIRNAVRAAVIASWSLLAACGQGEVHPPAGQSYLVTTKPYDGDLKAYASQVAIDAVLGTPGARLVQSVPYPGCPALGGLATYSLPKATPPAVMLLGFTVRDGNATTVRYTRPATAAADPGVTAAMRSTICHI